MENVKHKKKKEKRREGVILQLIGTIEGIFERTKMRAFYNEFCKAMYFLLLGVMLSSCFYIYEFRSLESSKMVVPFDNSAPLDSNFFTHTFRVTAYCSCSKCCGKFADNVTASGYIIHDGDRFIAAPPEYDFGTVMIIPGYSESKPVLVRDRGGVIKADKLDVYFDSHQEALNWGVRYLDVRVYYD